MLSLVDSKCETLQNRNLFIITLTQWHSVLKATIIIIIIIIITLIIIIIIIIKSINADKGEFLLL